MKRREVKDCHEESVLSSFKEHLRSQGKILTIMERPDPPDAIVKIDHNITWIEITDAFLNGNHARSLTSYAADDTEHVPSEETFIFEPDQVFLGEVVNVINKKYEKATITDAYKTHGSGILLVGLYSPFVDRGEIVDIIAEVLKMKRNKDSRFKRIYFYDQAHRFYPVE